MDLRELYKEDFPAEAIVTDLISRGDGQTQLEMGLRKFREYREQANLELRKNAFKYHSAILTASREMQDLEKNLTDLKSTLAEQKQLLENVTETAPEVEGAERDRRSGYFGNSLDSLASRYRSDATEIGVGDKDIPLWFREATLDIEDLYEMRQFEEATNLLIKAQEYFRSVRDTSLMTKADVYYRPILYAEEQLLIHLLQALNAALGCPFGINDSLTKLLVQLLRRLGKNYDACIAFLDLRTQLIHTSLKAKPLDRRSLIPVEARAEILFLSIEDALKKYHDFGFEGMACKSALNGWVKFHVDAFANDHLEQLFTSQASLTACASCVRSVRKHAARLTSLGMDLSLLLDGHLESQNRVFLEQMVKDFIENKTNLLKDQRIEPTVFPTKEAVASLDNIALSGLGMAAVYVDGLRLNIASQHIDFAKSFLQLVGDVTEIATESMKNVVNSLVKKAFEPLLDDLQYSVKQLTASKPNVGVLSATVDFCLKNLIPNAEDAMKTKFAIQSSQLFVTEKDALIKMQSTLKSKAKLPATIV
ncbi:hypothetical protein RvY_13591 [Ramazzottius varieornatus]|uniref:Exocyst component Exo84 C-terminal domain-containing protein n=1 Tax=Ramazzottius varieornatus TaxID=947166 RepID=A0A1D1VVU2_RAMVA|nr:hypothetical protein RvY_13591 [Ramazzottius varieornatus]